MAKKKEIRREKPLIEFFKKPKKEEKKEEVKPEEIVEKIRPVIKEEVEKAISEVIRTPRPRIISPIDFIREMEREYNIVFFPWEIGELQRSPDPMKTATLITFIKAMYKELYGSQQVRPDWLRGSIEALKEARRLYSYLKKNRPDILEKYRPLVQRLLSVASSIA